MKNIVLIGMPGAGKSTVGVVLAKKAGMKFVDSDLVIQEKTGKRLSDIIEEVGTDGFLKVEGKINGELDYTNSVIATGGSVVYESDAMKHLKEIGTVVYLKLPYAEIEDRLGDLNERGVVLKAGFTLKDLYEERIPLYEQYADVTISCEGKVLREVVKEIYEKLC